MWVNATDIQRDAGYYAFNFRPHTRPRASSLVLLPEDTYIRRGEFRRKQNVETCVSEPESRDSKATTKGSNRPSLIIPDRSNRSLCESRNC